MSNDIAIKVENVSKTFKLPHEKSSSIKSSVINFYKKNKGYEKQQALKDISFEVKKGEFFGIVGRNGSGKSTLLKIISGIYAPDSGGVHIVGKLTPFIELGVGFNPDLSGRENVYLNGALLGFNRKEVSAMYDEIVEFAELERFMDQKLKNYSSGMQVRLAFSIAIKAQSDILLLDEVLAVGDEAFQRKCYAYFEDLKQNKKTVILVTHDMNAVERFCDKAILIEANEIIERGEPDIVAHAYTRLFSPANTGSASDSSSRWGTKEIEISTLEVNPIKPHDKRVELNITLKHNQLVEKDVILAYTVKSKDRRSVFGGKVKIPKPSSEQTISYKFSFDNIMSKGDYYLDLSIRAKNEEEYIDFWIDAIGFSVESGEQNGLSILANTQIKQVHND